VLVFALVFDDFSYDDDDDDDDDEYQ